MKRTTVTGFAVAALIAITGAVVAQSKLTPDGTVLVGGQPMLKSKNIIENAVNSADHTTLVAAVKAAGLVDTLMTAGPFTVFAPTNDAFNALPMGTVDTLLKPENKMMLTKVLTYHVVAGRLDSATLKRLIMKANGTAMLKTVSGGSLWAVMNGPTNIVLKDEKGDIAQISTYDVQQSNGVIHVITKVLMPN